MGRAPATSPQSEAARWSAGRQLYLDNLKVVLIALIIAMHGIASYWTVEAWTYSWLREVTLAPVTEIVLVIVVLPFALFMIALLFLVAGLLTEPSMKRKGPGRFTVDRLLRLGIPFVAYVLLIQPLSVYALEHPLVPGHGSYWQEFLGDEFVVDTGPLWFVGALLVFSLAYAAWVRVHGGSPARPPHPIGARRLVVSAALVAPASFAIRLVYPYGSDAGFTDLNFWQWPACIAVFSLGITAARRGWRVAVPDRLSRTCRIVTLATMVAMAALLMFAGANDRIDDMLSGWTWLAVGFATLDAVLCMFGSVWLLGVAQRRLERPLPHGAALARSAYGAFIAQTPVLIGLALALRAFEVPAEVKAVLVAGGGVAVSFVIAWLVITRIPGVNRVL